MDTKSLRRDYPFLNKTWDMYDKFDATVEDYGYPDYRVKCGYIALNYGKNISEYNELCMKLLRNLYRMADVMDESENTNVPCTYLNMWLYHKEKIYKIPVEFIKNIFRIARELIQDLPYDSECKYDESHKNHQEPYKIMLLNIFLDNIDTVEEIMKNDTDGRYSTCLKYVKECLSIYNDIKTKYCPDKESHTINDTCKELKVFEDIYTLTISNESPLNEKMPSITYSDPILLDRVTSEYQSKVSMSDADDNSVNLGSDHASTIGGTVAGMGLFLLLMYQFTPLGRWLHSRINKRTGVSNNLGEEEMDHMYLNAYGNDSMYSDDMGYNMGYNTM
ncbi:PIR Superfamily Protein [Plasmodium ovale wallikeri]|uniref:PIR Superfamily Protein n=1 Tax=Plasmodium ovale wallikeri TaxID=864142 RepID=A0A1A9ATX0_PLAOA|nr:PIR Superfamily Protein [Plasmodium ovale wallikeri]